MIGCGKLGVLVVALLVVEAQSWKRWKHCPWVKCERNCRKVIGDDGCYKCECEQLCTPPKCDPGCEIQKVFDGPCPGCECKDYDDEVKPEAIVCDPPKCPRGCVIEKVFEGPCPGCDCKSKVDACFASEIFTFDHKQEGEQRIFLCCDQTCQFFEEPTYRWSHCPWVKCERNCRKVIGDDGCYKCECEKLCTPPKCGPGCEIQKVFDGPCPGCECKEKPIEVKTICDPIKCGAPCKEVPPESPDECPKCICEDYDDEVKEEDIVCDPPKCPRGCVIEKEFKGPCPGCDCKRKESRVDRIKPGAVICDPPKCPPGCSIEKEFAGPCPGCDCKDEDEDEVVEESIIDELACDPPKCPEGCKIEVEYEGACPTCACNGEGVMEPRKVQCSPPKCPPGCVIQKVHDGPCPGCDCPKKDIDEDIDEEKMCPELKKPCSGPGCKVLKDEVGCDICKCEPQCAPPKCRRSCRVKEVEGECPVCECPPRKFGWKHKRD